MQTTLKVMQIFPVRFIEIWDVGLLKRMYFLWGNWIAFGLKVSIR